MLPPPPTATWRSPSRSSSRPHNPPTPLSAGDSALARGVPGVDACSGPRLRSSGPMTYGVLGVGALGTAIVTGLCENVDDAPQMLLSPRNAETAGRLAERFASVDVAAENQALVDGAAVVIVCVRPQVAGTVLAELRFPADRVVISAMAGV